MVLRGFLCVALAVCSLSLTGCPSKDVIVIDDLPGVTIDKVWDDVCSFFTGDSAPFEVGDIIAGSGGGGFLRRVTAMDKSGDKITTATELVSLAEAIDKGTLKADIQITADDYAKSGAPLSKVSFDGTTLDLSGLVIYDKDGLSLRISTGTISFAPHTTLDAVWDGHKLQSMKLISEGVLSTNINLKLQATATQSLNYEVDIIPPIMQPFTFFIGPVPVTGYVSLTFPFGIAGSITGTASIESGFDSQQFVTLGAEYANGAWTELTDLGQFVPVGHPINWALSSNGGIDFYVKPKVTLDLYGVSDLSGAVIPYIAADAILIPSPITIVVSAGVNGELGYRLGIFDFNLVDKTWFFPGPKWELWRGTLPYGIPTSGTIHLWDSGS